LVDLAQIIEIAHIAVGFINRFTIWKLTWILFAANRKRRLIPRLSIESERLSVKIAFGIVLGLF
jgi:hypothetical protein